MADPGRGDRTARCAAAPRSAGAGRRATTGGGPSRPPDRHSITPTAGAAVPVCPPPLQAGSGAHLADLPPLPARSAARYTPATYTPATVTTRPLGGHQAHEAGGREARNMLRTAYVRAGPPPAWPIPELRLDRSRGWQGQEAERPSREWSAAGPARLVRTGPQGGLDGGEATGPFGALVVGIPGSLERRFALSELRLAVAPFLVR
jgi:hypothetical protein